MIPIQIKKLNTGAIFNRVDNPTSPLWVRGEYVKELKKFSIHKYEDVSEERFQRGTVTVYID